MAIQLKFDERQWPLAITGTLNLGEDKAVATGGSFVAFNADSGTVYDMAAMPADAVVIGGEVVVETVSDADGEATIAVGDADDAERYLAATTLKTAGRTALTLAGYRGNGEALRITLANNSGDTAGVVSIRVLYVVGGRANEVLPG